MVINSGCLSRMQSQAKRLVRPFSRKWTTSGRFLLIKKNLVLVGREPVLKPGDPFVLKKRGFLRVIYRCRLSVLGRRNELISESLITCLRHLKRIREAFWDSAFERLNHRGRAAAETTDEIKRLAGTNRQQRLLQKSRVLTLETRDLAAQKHAGGCLLIHLFSHQGQGACPDITPARVIGGDKGSRSTPRSARRVVTIRGHFIEVVTPDDRIEF